MKVKIGKRHYKITKKRISPSCYADCDVHTKEIRINHDVHPRAYYRKLLHEIFHGIFHEYLKDFLSDKEEERVIRALERGLKDFATNYDNQVEWIRLCIGLMKK